MRLRTTMAGLVRACLTSTLLMALGGPVGAQPEPQHAYLVENGVTTEAGEPALLAPENTALTRFDDRIEIEIRMPTPTPGTYVYPADVPPERYAAPEVFTLWAFVFNHPEHCVSADEPPTCGAEDFTDAVRAGVYGVAGHLTSIDHSGSAFELDRGTDGEMVLRGAIEVGQAYELDLPPNDDPKHALENPMGAEVHVAIAPHGQVVPATIGTEMYAPAGDPTCGCWWVAFFEGDAG